MKTVKSGLLGMSNNNDPIDEKSPPITNQHRQDWNNYTSWLEKKGMKGNPILDKGGNDVKMIEQYRKENPSTTVSKDMIIPIQKEFSKLRDYQINELRNKKAMYVDAKNPNGRFITKDENMDGYMRDLSISDGIAGQKTTSHVFPQGYMKTYMNDKLQNVQNTGFVASK